MFSLDFIKTFFLCALVFLLLPACGFWRKNDAEQPPALAVEELKAELPFSIAEPENFQAEVVISTGSGEQRNFVARRGEKRRYEYAFGKRDQITVLQTDQGYLILPNEKIYAASSAAENIPAAENWADFLTFGWLEAKTAAEFEKLETVGNLTKYRAQLDGKVSSEVLIFVDETRGLVVRQEFYTVSGAQKVLNFTFELVNLKFETAENLFIVPPDFRQVSISELRKRISKNK